MNHALMITNQRFKGRRAAILSLPHQFCVSIGHGAWFYRIRQTRPQNPLNYFFTDAGWCRRDPAAFKVGQGKGGHGRNVERRGPLRKPRSFWKDGENLFAT
jgi:hypothetical protein